MSLPEPFPIYCYFMSTILPQTSAVKTLPLHTPISLVLSFFFPPMNSQFDFFILTEFLFSFNMKNRSACHIPVYVLSFQFIYFSNTTTIPKPVLTHRKHHRLFRSWHNATTKFNHHNIHNSFGNSVIQSAYQPFVYSRLN